MRQLTSILLLVLAGAASAQVEPPAPFPPPTPDPDVLQAGAAWLVGDHVKARRHFRAAAERGHRLGQYNLAMMLLHREGGPCDPAEALALLRKSAEGGVGLARGALEKIQVTGMPPPVIKHPFPCAVPRQGPARITLE
jgi:TPR repeat protein